MKDKIKTAFESVHAEETLKADTKAFLAEKMQRHPGRRTALHRRWIPVMAACFILIFAGFGSYQAYFTPTSVISIDINPSLEVSVNRFDRVISIEGYNDDGKALASSLHIRFMNYTEALEQILASEPIAACLEQNEILSVTVVGGDTAQSGQILSQVESCTAGQKNVHCASLTEEEAASAHECGLSYGKYQAYLTVQALDPDITPEQIQHMTMREIRDLIASLSQSDADTAASTAAQNGDHHTQSAGHRYQDEENKRVHHP